MKHAHIFIALLTSIIMLVSCNPDVELCREDTHPHLGSITYQYDWTNASHTPDSMYIIANRVINLWKCSMVVNSGNGIGRYLFNAPAGTAVATPTDTTTADTTSTDTIATDSATTKTASTTTD